MAKMSLNIYMVFAIWNFFIFRFVFGENPYSSNFFPLTDERIRQCHRFYDSVCRAHENIMQKEDIMYDEERDSAYVINQFLIDNVLIREAEDDESVDLSVAKKLYSECIQLNQQENKKIVNSRKRKNEEKIAFKNVDSDEAEPETSEEKSTIEEIEDKITSFISEEDPKTFRKWFKDSVYFIGTWPMASEFCNSTSFDFAKAFAYLTMGDVDPLFTLGRKGEKENGSITVSPGSLVFENLLYYNEYEFPEQVTTYIYLIKDLVHSYRKHVLGIHYPHFTLYDSRLDYHIELLFQFERKLAKVFLEFSGSNADGTEEFSLTDFSEKWNREIKCEFEHLEVNWAELITSLFPDSLIEDAKELKIAVPRRVVKGKVSYLVSSVAAILDSTDPYVIDDYFQILWTIKRGTLLLSEFRQIYGKFLREALEKDLHTVDLQCASIISKYMDATMTKSVEKQDPRYNLEEIWKSIKSYINGRYNIGNNKKISDAVKIIAFGTDITRDETNLDEIYYEFFGPTNDFSMDELMTAEFPDILHVMIFTYKRRTLANYVRRSTADSTLKSIERQPMYSWEPKIKIVELMGREGKFIYVPLAVDLAIAPVTDLLSYSDNGYFWFIGSRILRIILEENSEITSAECDDKEEYERVKCYRKVLNILVPGAETSDMVIEDVVHEILREIFIAQSTFNASKYMVTKQLSDEILNKKNVEFFETFAKESCSIYKSDISVVKAVKAGVVPMRIIVDNIANYTHGFKSTYQCP